MSNWLRLAESVLNDSKSRALHVREIASLIKENNPNLTNEVDSIMIKVAASLANNVKSKKPIFKKIKNKHGGYKRGVYSLKVKKANPLKKVVVEDSNNKVNTLYTGKAGEYSVLSELMFRGYNSTVLPIDDGIDVIAEKDNQYYHIQVKSSLRPDGNNFQFTIKQSIFTAKNSSQTYYIFLMRYVKADRFVNDFAIFHTREIQNYIATNVVQDKPTLNIKINIENGKYCLNRVADITSNINNFNIS